MLGRQDDFKRHTRRLGGYFIGAMISGTFHLKNYGNWKITYFLLSDESDAGDILYELRANGCSPKFMRNARRILYSGRKNTGMAYSNPRRKSSVLVVSGTTDVSEFLNSFAHEIDHVEKHVARTLHFSPYSEKASYLVGEIIQNIIHKTIHRFTCWN